jgi:hypothetical protein
MNTFKRVEQGIASRLTKLTGQHAKQRAIGRAFAAFEKKHPNWASSMFDKHFLQHGAAAIIEKYMRGDDASDAAEELASAWVHQLGASSALRPWLQADALPAAAEFLHLIQGELADRSVPTVAGLSAA